MPFTKSKLTFEEESRSDYNNTSDIVIQHLGGADGDKIFINRKSKAENEKQWSSKGFTFDRENADKVIKALMEWKSNQTVENE